MLMTDYQFKVSDCINDKLVDFCMTEAKSIYNVDLLYHHYIQEVSTIFHTPREHYTKILTIAYHKTIKEMSK